MNNTPASPVTAAPRSRYRVWKWLGFSFLGLFVLSVLGVASMFFLDGDASSLRDEMKAARGESALQTRVQLSLGPVSLGLARAVLGCVNGVDEEARLALSAVRGVSVGVYSISSDGSKKESPDFEFAQLDQRMTRRGWERMVAVRDQGKVVLVYAPTDASSRKALPLCVGVIDGDKMVIVSLRGDPEPILKIANMHRTGHRL